MSALLLVALNALSAIAMMELVSAIYALFFGVVFFSGQSEREDISEAEAIDYLQSHEEKARLCCGFLFVSVAINVYVLWY